MEAIPYLNRYYAGVRPRMPLLRTISAPRLLAVAAVITVLGGTSRSAFAHQASTTYTQIGLTDDRRSADVRLLATPADLAEALGLPADSTPRRDQLTAGAPRLFAYVLPRVALRDGATACAANPGGVGLDGDGFAELRWTVTCPAPIEQLVVEYELFFDLDPLHVAFLRVDVPGRPTADAQLRDGEGRFVWNLGEAPPSYLTAYLWSGVEHILLGIDHIAFLLALLLVVVIGRRDDGAWRRRGLRDGLRHTALIVTAFTVAHSVTLIAAALGWIDLPSRFVESMIAASIVYVAVENVLRPDVRYRHAVTFAFGLMHGLGFASMLQVMLPPSGVVAPLLMFNLGVELGQLAFVIVALPALDLVCRAVGADRYRRRVLPALGALLALAGLAWLIQRALDL